MKTSEFIELNAHKLHQLLDENLDARTAPDVIDSFFAIVEHIDYTYPVGQEVKKNLETALSDFYGADAQSLSPDAAATLRKKIRTGVAHIATLSTRLKLRGD
jgi:formyltetrahydrofolate synthetase